MNNEQSLLGALGDIHGDFESVRRIMQRHPRVPAWLCVGDVGNDEGTYLDVPSPLVWIKGNNELFDFVAAQEKGTVTVSESGTTAETVTVPRNLIYLPNAVPREVEGVTVLGVGGTLAPT